MPLPLGLYADGQGAGPSGWQGAVRACRAPATVPPLVKLEGHRQEVFPGPLSGQPQSNSTGTWSGWEPALSTGWEVRCKSRAEGEAGSCPGWDILLLMWPSVRHILAQTGVSTLLRGA